MNENDSSRHNKNNTQHSLFYDIKHIYHSDFLIQKIIELHQDIGLLFADNQLKIFNNGL